MNSTPGTEEGRDPTTFLLISNGRCCECSSEEDRTEGCRCLCHEADTKEWCDLCQYWHYYDVKYRPDRYIRLYDDSYLAMIGAEDEFIDDDFSPEDAEIYEDLLKDDPAEES